MDSMTALEKFKQTPFDRSKLTAVKQSNLYRNYMREYVWKESVLKPVLQELLQHNSANNTATIINTILGGEYFNAGGVIKFCKKWDIPTHTFSEAALLPECKTMKKATNTIRYGAGNPFCRNTTTYQKKIETVKKRYGVDNIRKSNVFKTNRKKTMLARYGVEVIGFLKERCNGRRSKLQKRVENLLINLGIPFDYEVPGKFKAFNELLQKEYNPIVDILIEDKKLVIEVYGNHWHANPKLFKGSDIISRWDGNVTAEHIWQLDESRVSQIKSFNYNVLVLWESDILYNEKYVSDLIQNACKA